MNKTDIRIERHPVLDVAAFSVEHFDNPSPQMAQRLLSLGNAAVALSPFDIHSDADHYSKVKSAVRDVLRHGGYKPTGRGKPASEYLVKAVGDGKLGSINPIVDTLNAVSLHSGLPISVVDLSKCECGDGHFSIAIAGESAEYVFNTSGQTIKLSGLVCLCDSLGPCANAVKDSQRTKTDDSTTSSLVVIWGTKELPGHSTKTESWFRELVEADSIGRTFDSQISQQ